MEIFSISKILFINHNESDTNKTMQERKYI